MNKEKLSSLTETWGECFVYGFIFFTPIGHAGASVCLGLLAVCFVIRKALHPDFHFLKKPEHLWLLIFFLFCGLSLVNSGPYLPKSLIALLLKWGKYLLVFLFFREALTNPARRQRVGWVILTVAVIVGLDCLVQFFRGTDLFYAQPLFMEPSAYKALTATFHSRNDLASYLGFATLMALAMAVTASTRRSRWMLGSLAFFLGTCLLRTYSRGALIGLCGGFFLMLLLSRRWKVLLPVLIFFVLAILSKAALAKRVIDLFLFAAGQRTEGSITIRFDYWQVALQLIRENPFLGKGLGTFMDYCGQRALTLDTNYVHNCYLQIWAESGLFSLFALLLFFGILLRKGIRVYKRTQEPLLLGLICGIFAFLIHSFFDTQFYSVAQAYLLWSMLGILAAATVDVPILLPQESPIKKLWSILGGSYQRSKQILEDGKAKLLGGKIERPNQNPASNSKPGFKIQGARGQDRSIHFKMKNNKALGFCGLVLAIFIGIAFVRFFETLPAIEAHGPTTAQAPLYPVPDDFNWKTYVQNYDDLQRARIDTEERAKRHWVEFGKQEGRNYHPLRSAEPAPATKLPEPPVVTPQVPVPAVVTAPVKLSPAYAVSPEAVSRFVSRIPLDPPKFDPANVRKRYNKVMKRAGVKTRQEAMDFSLAFWEKRRKDYFS